jgi:homoserine kinase
LSGAGPSVLSIVDAQKADANGVLESVLGFFRGSGVAAKGFVTSVGKGAKVVESS